MKNNSSRGPTIILVIFLATMLAMVAFSHSTKIARAQAAVTSINTLAAPVPHSTDDGATFPVLVTGPDEGHGPTVDVVRHSPAGFHTNVIEAYPRNFTGGVRVATGDVDGDGRAEIITAPGPGMAPHVRIFDSVTGRPFRPQRDFMAYRANFQGGVFVAAGDVNGDGRAEVITGAGDGGRPVVRIFDGLTGNMLNSFLAYDAAFRGGVHVAAGDVNGDGIAEIITGPGAGAGPVVKIFSPIGPGLLQSFLAYPANFLGGVYLDCADFNHDGFAEIITGPGAGGPPLVKVFDVHDNLNVLRSFLAFSPSFSGGVHVAFGDFNGDGRVDGADFVVGAGPGAGPHVKVFAGRSGAVLRDYFAYPNFSGGVFVAGFKR